MSARRIRVTFCAYDKPDSVGGPVSWIQRLLPELEARGFEVRCLFILHWGDTGPALAALRQAGIQCDAVSGLDRTEERIAWILERLRENPPDVFVPNLVVAAYYAARYARESGTATVGILHSDDAFYRGIADAFVAGDRPWRVSSVVCVSSRLERQLAEREIAGARVERIPYGVDVPDGRVEREDGRLRLAFVGRFAEEQKRIGDVTRALCAAARLDGVEATLYGDGPDRATVARILEEEGAGLPVRLGGIVASDRIQETLLSADAIVLLSDYEGLPISLLEAMACGCVPVAMRMRSGIPELVEDGVTGLIVEDRRDSFVAAIARLRDDRALWERLSSRAREHVARSFSSKSSAGMWESLLRGLAHDSSPREIRPPARYDLPRVHPALASADVRVVRVGLSSRLYRSTRIFLGRMRQSLTGSR